MASFRLSLWFLTNIVELDDGWKVFYFDTEVKLSAEARSGDTRKPQLAGCVDQ